MASGYPASIDALATNKSDATAMASDHAGHHNDLADAVNKIETELGTNPKGSSATVKARLDTLAPKASPAFTSSLSLSSASLSTAATLESSSSSSFAGGRLQYVSGSKFRVLVDGVANGAVAGNTGSLIVYVADSAGALNQRLILNDAGLIIGTGTSLGAWSAWTPVLGGTGWAIGDGTAVGYYCQIGKIVIFRLRVTFGSTSTFGSGALTISPPVTARFSGAATGVGFTVDSSVGTVMAGVTASLASTTALLPRGPGNPAYGFSTTAPWTWATGDYVELTGTYEAA